MPQKSRQISAQTHKRARNLRKEASPYEQKLWEALRQNAFPFGLKFRRQQPIAAYIIDFACMKAKLLVELDGASHDVRVNYDLKREIYLRERGYEVIRFRNDEVMGNLSGIVETIIETARSRIVARGPLTGKN